MLPAGPKIQMSAVTVPQVGLVGQDEAMRSGRVADVGDLDQWRAEVTGRVGNDTFGPLLLPHDEPVTLGRAKQCGVLADHLSVSRALATVAPSALGWVLANGKRTRVRAESPFVVAASFAPAAQVLPQPADWRLTWDLDVLTEVTVRYRRAGHGEPYPIARDGESPESSEDPEGFVGTAVNRPGSAPTTEGFGH